MLAAMPPVTYVNGRFVAEEQASVSVLDHGLLYGDGVFEGIRAYNGRVFKLERHVQRLFASAHALRLAVPATFEEVCQIVLATCARNTISDGYVRLLVTRGAGGLGVSPRRCTTPQIIAIACQSMSVYDSTSTGIRMCTSSMRRPSTDALSPSIKSLNYLNNVLARMEATDRGADEALILDSEGFVAEASADNIFIVDRDGLATPPLTAALPGITRETVIELARAAGVPWTERRLSLFDVWTAREVFVCGTAAEIVPVVSVDERVIGDGTTGPMTRAVMDRYAMLVRSTGTPIVEGTLQATA
jgi:branched-chain amino acid aminotransferase